MIHGKNILLLLLLSKALLCEVYTGTYHTWSLSTKNISIYTNANPLPLVLQVCCTRHGTGATKGERSRHDSFVRYQLVKDCRINSSFHSVLFNTTTQIPEPVEFPVKL